MSDTYIVDDTCTCITVEDDDSCIVVEEIPVRAGSATETVRSRGPKVGGASVLAAVGNMLGSFSAGAAGGALASAGGGAGSTATGSAVAPANLPLPGGGAARATARANLPLPHAAEHVYGCQQIPSLCRCLVPWLYCYSAASGAEEGPRCGKWMLFPSPQYMDSVWEKVKALTQNGSLGFAAKIAAGAQLGDPKPVVVCVYLQDSFDIKNVMRVLCTLKDEGLLGKAVTSFKMDSQTLQNVYSIGGKRPREGEGVEWPKNVAVSRYTCPPQKLEGSDLQLNLNHVSKGANPGWGVPWSGENTEDLLGKVRCLVAVRRSPYVGMNGVEFFKAPYETIKK